MCKVPSRMRLCNLLLLQLLLLLFPGQHLSAQQAYIDSLQNELSKSNQPDTTRMALLLDLGAAIRYSNITLARSYYRQACPIAEKVGDNYAMLTALAGIGHTFYTERAYDSALYYYRLSGKAAKKDTRVSAQENEAMINCDIASVLLAQGNYQPAIQSYLKAVDIIRKGNAPEKWRNIGTCYLSIGVINHDLHQDKKALQNYLQGLTAYKKQKGTELEIAYALMYASSSLLALNRVDEARDFLDKTQIIADSLQQGSVSMQLFKDWGLYYRKTKNYPAAINSFKKALHLSQKIGEKLEEQYNLTQLGNAYNEKGDYTASLRYYVSALELARKSHHKADEKDILKKLSQVSSLIKNYKTAVKYYQQYIQLSDSLNETEVTKKISELEATYQGQKKEDSILVLRKNAQLRQLELHKKKTQNTLLFLSCGALLLLMALAFINFKRKNQLLRQSEQLQRQKLTEMEKKQQIQNLEAVLEGQEAERSRLAKDLHDGVGGLLSGVKLSLSTIQGNVFLSEGNAGKLGTVINQLDASIQELRRVSHNMMPESLIKFGLHETLVSYCDSINDSGQIKVQLQSYGNQERLDQHTEIVLFRIIQELLSNVIKHSKAANVLVQLVQQNNWFSLTVEDDGIGFDVHEVEEKAGAGLSNIRARAQYLGANMDIHSGKGEGTSVNIEGTVT